MSSERPVEIGTPTPASGSDLLAALERYCEVVAIPTLFRMACPNLWAAIQEDTEAARRIGAARAEADR